MVVSPRNVNAKFSTNWRENTAHTPGSRAFVRRTDARGDGTKGLDVDARVHAHAPLARAVE